MLRRMFLLMLSTSVLALALEKIHAVRISPANSPTYCLGVDVKEPGDIQIGEQIPRLLLVESDHCQVWRMKRRGLDETITLSERWSGFTAIPYNSSYGAEILVNHPIRSGLEKHHTFTASRLFPPLEKWIMLIGSSWTWDEGRLVYHEDDDEPRGCLIADSRVVRIGECTGSDSKVTLSPIADNTLCLAPNTLSPTVNDTLSLVPCTNGYVDYQFNTHIITDTYATAMIVVGAQYEGSDLCVVASNGTQGGDPILAMYPSVLEGDDVQQYMWGFSTANEVRYQTTATNLCMDADTNARTVKVTNCSGSTSQQWSYNNA
ncbi:hypothetical protein M231_03216 [Tremella mesenterica]|uniref:Ricin B lectin domain-containing protein n=1 Tax=Tremella mesenterica TaxID=5217 RepID=A0A4V1M491_TREME|nr:hypothetical protein M231_03216 [Tremella mesenterica]